jgi:hypothetical protein
MKFVGDPLVDSHVRWQPTPQRSSHALGYRLPAILLLALLAAFGLGACSSVERDSFNERPPSNKIAASAWKEWSRFGRSTVVYGGQANGYVNRNGVTERSEPLASRVGDYWGACGHPEWNGRTQSRPWSGAFVSWVMKDAGVSPRDFPPNGRHGGYLSSLYERQRSGAFTLHGPHDYSPKPGDLVCAGTAGASWKGADFKTAKKRIDSTVSHCDVVTEVRGGFAHAVGGNIKNSVTMSLYPVDGRGRLMNVQGRPWMLVAENRAY